MKRLIIIFFLVLGVNRCVLIPHLIPFNNIPQPTGLYSVGTQIFEWEDVNREEWFTDDIGDFRLLVVQVWYPTLEKGNQVVSYIDFPDKRIGPLSKRMELPQFLIRHIQDVKSNAILNSAIRIDKNLYPLILFSHGLGGMRMQNTVQMEELASRGYIVVAMDHPYDANVTVYNDGTTAEFRSGLREGASEKEFWDVRMPQINTRAYDISFIINKISFLKEKGNQLWKSVNLSKIGVLGHSYGGSTCILASFNDSRIDACINLDGWMEPIESKIIKEGLDIPFLYIGQEKWIDTPLNDKKRDSLIISSNGKKVLLPGTQHFDYSDTPQFSPISTKFGVAGSMDIHLLRNKINSEIISFFDLYVKQAE